MFEQTLSDIVKGLRTHKRNPSPYISTVITACKTELSSPNMIIKSNALRKLTYLRLRGLDFKWSEFGTIEVMSCRAFCFRRVGFLSASISFNADTEVILLCTNLIKKDFQSVNIYDIGLAINCLANIMTKDLARELLPDLLTLLTHNDPYIRKKSVLCMYKLFTFNPPALRLTFANVKLLLADSNTSVQSCAVNVICELASKNPKNYILLAPSFFNLLVGTSNNWMLIKVVKLFGSLVEVEPRLARKLLAPLGKIVETTLAKSLLYESVYTLTLALPYCYKDDGSVPTIFPSIVKLVSSKLKLFTLETDQNLKYLGLVGFIGLMRSNPKEVCLHKDIILKCLTDDDVTIRSRALELLAAMVTRGNLRDLVSQLLRHVILSDGNYRELLIEKIVEMCKSEKYALVADFYWYLTVLRDMGGVRGNGGSSSSSSSSSSGSGNNGSGNSDTKITSGRLIANQIIDVTLRVPPARSQSVKICTATLLTSNIIMGKSKVTDKHVLEASAFVCGEFGDFIARGEHGKLMGILVDFKRNKDLDAKIQAIFLAAAIKIFSAACSKHKSSSSGSDDDEVSDEELCSCVEELVTNLPGWMESQDCEVMERGVCIWELLRGVGILKGERMVVNGGVAAVAAAGGDGGGEGYVDDDKERKASKKEKKKSKKTNQQQLDIHDIQPTQDFLGLTMTPTTIQSTQTLLTQSSNDIFSDPALNYASLSTSCRAAAATLQAMVCTPARMKMKPISIKAQNKLPLPTSVDINAPVDGRVFKELIKQDGGAMRRDGSGSGNGNNGGIDEVYFGFFGKRNNNVITGNGNGKFDSKYGVDSSESDDDADADADMQNKHKNKNKSKDNSGSGSGSASRTSSSRSSSTGRISPPTTNTQYNGASRTNIDKSDGTPFYLADDVDVGVGDGVASPEQRLKGGEDIMLSDIDIDDGDGDRGGGGDVVRDKKKEKKGKKSKKKGKKEKKEKENENDDSKMKEDVEGIFGEVLASDDDDDDDTSHNHNHNHTNHHTSNSKSKNRKHHKHRHGSSQHRSSSNNDDFDDDYDDDDYENQSLAEVDLSRPLREDEIVVERKHHVVADAIVSAVSAGDGGGGDVKKSKAGKKGKVKDKDKDKDKESKRKNKSRTKENNSDDTHDLLNFDNNNNMPSNTVHTMLDKTYTPINSSNNNSSSNGNEELLSMSAISIPDVDVDVDVVKSKGTGTSNDDNYAGSLWMNAGIKSRSSAGPFEALVLQYKIIGNTSSSVTIEFKANNNKNSNLSVTLDDDCGAVEIHQPNVTYTLNKAYNFQVKCDTHKDIKGTIRIDSYNVESVLKLVLPVSLNFRSDDGADIESIMTELDGNNGGKNQFYSATIKLKKKSTLNELCKHFNNPKIILASGGATLAMVSGSSSVRIRLLCKFCKGEGEVVRVVDVKVDDERVLKEVIKEFK